MRAFRKLDQLKNSDQFAHWLVGIARRMAIDWQRRSVAKNNLKMEPFFDHHIRRTDDSLPIRLEELHQAISELPEREQLAIHVHYLTEQPATYAQEILQLSTSGFYKLLDRARKNLANKMTSKEGIT